MEDFFGEVEVVEAEDIKFQSRDITEGFNLANPKYLKWSNKSKADNVCPQIIFLGNPFESDKATGWDLPNGEKAKCQIGVYNIGKWKQDSEWSSPTKEMVMELGSNLIALFNKMSPDIEKKYRQAIKGINPMTDFDKFFKVSQDFLSKPMKPVYIKVKRSQRESDPKYFNYDICSNKVSDGVYQFIAVNPTTVKSTEKNDEGVIVKLEYTNSEGVIKTLTYDYNNSYDNKMLPPEATAMDESFNDMPDLDMGEEEDLAF